MILASSDLVAEMVKISLGGSSSKQYEAWIAASHSSAISEEIWAAAPSISS